MAIIPLKTLHSDLTKAIKSYLVFKTFSTIDLAEAEKHLSFLQISSTTLILQQR
jgi:hypothetical protein